MKNIITLCLLLTASCSVFGQTATTDSTVTIPKRWFKKATADLMRYDDCREEISLLKPRIAAKEEVIRGLAKDTAAQGDMLRFMDAQLKSERTLSKSLEANCNADLAAYQKQAVKEKRKGIFQTIFTAVVGVAVGFMVGSLAN